MAPVSSMPLPCRGHAVPHGPRGPHPPKGGGISGVARDVATCAAEAVCVRGGPLGGSGGRGPTGSDITPVPLSPPTPLKNPEPVSLPPSRTPPYSFPSKLTGPKRTQSSSVLGTFPLVPAFPSRLSEPRAASLRIPQVPAGREPAPLPGSVHRESRVQRPARGECRVQSRGGGASAPAGESAGQEAGGERAARGWGRLESSPWPRSLHGGEISTQPTKAEGVLAKTVFPPAGARSSVRENVWSPVIPAGYSVQALVRDCIPRTPQFTRSSGQNSPELQSVSYQALGNVQR